MKLLRRARVRLPLAAIWAGSRTEVSRSFASVIRQLPAGLTTDVLIFYLVLRGLDTVEDDMEAFKGREGEKVHVLL